jgi:hypothetical protein
LNDLDFVRAADFGAKDLCETIADVAQLGRNTITNKTNKQNKTTNQLQHDKTIHEIHHIINQSTNQSTN